MALQRNPCVIFLSFFMAAEYFDESCGLEYRVGDSVWSIPPYPHYYSDWSSAHLFYMDDSLVFDFETEFSNLIEVAPLDYQSCTANNPIKIISSGPATILLKEAGVFYFLCNLSNYCELGQKICIIVQDRHANFPPTPTPSPLPVVTPPVLSPIPVPTAPSPLPVTPPTVLSPEPSPAGNRDGSESPPPPVPGRSDQAPSPTTDLGHTFSSSNGCSCSVGSGFVNVAIYFTIWVIFFVNLDRAGLFPAHDGEMLPDPIHRMH
ncbi:hypothetical protein ACOSQ4_033401 [Xanthoceras sorbifolium]